MIHCCKKIEYIQKYGYFLWNFAARFSLRKLWHCKSVVLSTKLVDATLADHTHASWMFYCTSVDSNALTLLLGLVVDLLYNLSLQLCRSWQEFDTAELLVISEPSRYSGKTEMKARPHWKFCSRPLSRVLNAISNLWWSSKNLKKIIKKFSRATKASANCISQINAKFLTRKFALQSKSVFGASCIQCNLTAHYLFITARCCASAVLAMALCLSVRLCLSQVGVLLKRQNVGSHKQHHPIPQGV